MDISKFQDVCGIRSVKWGTIDWTLLEWCGAMCGESGEAANVAKKIRRLSQNLPNKEAGISKNNLPELKKKLAMEIADSIIYGLIVLSEIDVDASQILAEVFDQKSIEYGFKERAPVE